MQKKYLYIRVTGGTFIIYLDLEDCEKIIKIYQAVQELHEPNPDQNAEITYSIVPGDYLFGFRWNDPGNDYFIVKNEPNTRAEELECMQTIFSKNTEVYFRARVDEEDTIKESYGISIKEIEKIRDSLLPNSIKLINNLKD